MEIVMRFIGVVLSAALLAGCAGQTPAAAPGAASAPPAATSAAGTAKADPVALIGLWKLSVEGGPQDAVLRVGADDDLGLFLPCLALMGGWRADDAGLFLSYLDSYTSKDGGPACASADVPTPGPQIQPDWLARVAGYRIDGAERLLLDESGATVARLRPGARPVSRSDMADVITGVPVVTGETRKRLAPAAPLPSGLTAATTPALLGKWWPKDRTTKAYAEFQAGGRWQGSDGCNGTGGSWVTGPGGSLLAVAGPSTLIGCANVPIGSWLNFGRRAGFDGETLVLLDIDGKELGRLNR
jgi:hypothetical protein